MTPKPPVLFRQDSRTEEALAKALYETAPGTNGYPPQHESIPWADAWASQEYYREKAAEVLRIMAEGSR